MNEQEIRQKVKKLLLSNVKEGYSELLYQKFSYIMPAPGNYPFQWWWDTCFHVFILCAIGEHDLAKRNMHSMFSLQAEDGFVGHTIFWNSVLPTNKMDVIQARPTLLHLRPPMSSLIQPPFAAQAVQRIYEETKDECFLKEILPKLKKYHHWLIKNRDFEGDGLLSIITPFESGMDWKPSYDEVIGHRSRANKLLYWKVISLDLRNFLHRYNLKSIYTSDYFIVKEVAFNTAYALDLYSMSWLCEQLKDKDSNFYTKRAKQVASSMVDKMYDEETCAFYDVLGKRNKKSKVLTPTIFFPIVLDDISDVICQSIVKNHLHNDQEFALPYPIPSVAKKEPSFEQKESKFLWRGPTWVFYNWFLYRCFIHKGYKKEADHLLQTVFKLIEKSGFREYYNSFTGEGYGAKNFTWSGLIVDMLRLRKKG